MLFKSHRLIWKALPMLMCVCVQFATESDSEGERGRGGRRIERAGVSKFVASLSLSTGRGDYVSLLSCVLTFRMLLNFNRLSSGFTDYSYWGWIHYSGITSLCVFTKITIAPAHFSPGRKYTCTHAYMRGPSGHSHTTAVTQLQIKSLVGMRHYRRETL